MKSFFKFKYLFLSLVTVVTVLFGTVAFAKETSTVTFSYVGGGVEFKIYRAGDIGSDNKAVLTGDFAKYNVDVDDVSSANTLAMYAQRDNLSPYLTTLTNGSHNAVFTGLERGLYLITGADCVYGNKKYIAKPVLLSVPNTDEKRNIKLVGKYETEKTPTPPGPGPSDDTINISVLKVWNGSHRESSITAQLLKDGTVYNEVVLSSSNNWRYTWHNLSENSKWTVTEKNISGEYEVKIDKDGKVFIITNTYKEKHETTTEGTTAEVTTSEEHHEKTTEPTKPNEPDEPDEPDRPDVPDNPSTPPDNNEPPTPDENTPPGHTPEYGETGNKLNRPNKDTEPPKGSDEKEFGRPNKSEKLPQTGQLWWPVPILSSFGILCLIVGIGYKREEE